ncbi:BnaC05g32200D [Brassica napus]|uniref:BnaC05g32200D protein n=1 Tax=Brassica napus TaxID=3708 RepID=A0A078GSH5_BRANA|nr:BnaC05g32200D [Brassica napus]
MAFESELGYWRGRYEDGDVPYNPRGIVRQNDVVSSIPLQPIPRSSGPINGLGLFAFERTTSFPHRFSDLFMFNHQLYIAKFPEIIWEVV